MSEVAARRASDSISKGVRVGAGDAKNFVAKPEAVVERAPAEFNPGQTVAAAAAAAAAAASVVNVNASPLQIADVVGATNAHTNNTRAQTTDSEPELSDPGADIDEPAFVTAVPDEFEENDNEIEEIRMPMSSQTETVEVDTCGEGDADVDPITRTVLELRREVTERIREQTGASAPSELPVPDIAGMNWEEREEVIKLLFRKVHERAGTMKGVVNMLRMRRDRASGGRAMTGTASNKTARRPASSRRGSGEPSKNSALGVGVASAGVSANPGGTISTRGHGNVKLKTKTPSYKAAMKAKMPFRVSDSLV